MKIEVIDKELTIEKYNSLKSGRIFAYGYYEDDSKSWAAYKRKSDNSWCIWVRDKKVEENNIYSILSGKMINNQFFIEVDKEVDALYSCITLVK